MRRWTDDELSAHALWLQGDRNIEEICDQAREANALRQQLDDLRAEVERLRSIAPYVEDSGHYCHGMTHAWTDAQAALSDCAEAEDEANRLREVNARLRADLECATQFEVGDDPNSICSTRLVYSVNEWYVCRRRDAHVQQCASRDEALAIARQWAGEGGEK